MAVKATTSAYPGEAVPRTRSHYGRGRPPWPRCWPNGHPVNPSPPTTGCPPCPQTPHQDTRPPGEDPSADRTRLPRTQDRSRPHPLRRPLMDRLAPPRHPGFGRPSLPHRTTPDQPKSSWGGLTSYKIIQQLQALRATWTGRCPPATSTHHDEPTKSYQGSVRERRPGWSTRRSTFMVGVRYAVRLVGWKIQFGCAG